MTDRLLSLEQLQAEFVPLAPSTIYQHVSEGKFPKPCKIANRTVWKLSDIQRHIEGMGA